MLGQRHLPIRGRVKLNFLKMRVLYLVIVPSLFVKKKKKPHKNLCKIVSSSVELVYKTSLHPSLSSRAP